MKVILPVLLLLVACAGDKGNIREVASVNIKEASALEYSNGKLWTLEDRGNKSILYSLDSNGTILHEINVDAKNNDWESLASDRDGNLYIGDFGNNANKRNDLSIYKIDAVTLNNTKAKVSSVIQFSYPEQTDFPPKKSGRLYDCEAFIEHKGYFYLFTKNRSSEFDGSLFVYSVPNSAGKHKARLLGEIKTCNKAGTCAVTGADISPDGKSMILLTADTVYEITGFGENDISEIEVEALSLGHSSQKEGICFQDDTTIMMIDERTENSGGKLYEANLNELKAKR